MKIQFEPNEQTIRALSTLLKRNPGETPDTLLNELIQDAAKALEPQLDKVELLDVAAKVSAFIIEHHKPSTPGNVREYLDICYKRGIVTRDYTLDRAQLHRVCKWVLDDLILHPRFRTMSHVVSYAFIRDH